MRESAELLHHPLDCRHTVLKREDAAIGVSIGPRTSSRLPQCKHLYPISYLTTYLPYPVIVSTIGAFVVITNFLLISFISRR